MRFPRLVALGAFGAIGAGRVRKRRLILVFIVNPEVRRGRADRQLECRNSVDRSHVAR